MNVTDEDLDAYLLTSRGMSRLELNAVCLIGLFACGWLLIVVFARLRRTTLGFLYFVPVFVLSVAGAQAFPWCLIPAVALYLLAWVHANVLLSGFRTAARERIAVLDRIRDEAGSADDFLERGLLAAKVLRDRDEATRDFAAALALPGGDARLCNLSGLEARRAGQRGLARELFDRGLEAAVDPRQVAVIQRNRGRVVAR